MDLTTEPLTPTTGVAVLGLEAAAFHEREVGAACAALLDEHGMVIFRGVHLSDDDLVAFSRHIGTVVVAPKGSLPGRPEVSAISLDPAKDELAAFRRGTFFWHIDGANDSVPQKATLLTAKEVDAEGGDTEFANTYAAYDALSDDDKARYADVRVVHSLTASQRLVYPEPSPKQVAAWERVPSREHPLVWTRPNGRKSLLVGATTEAVVGMNATDGRALLDRLLAWATQPRFVVRHAWEPGDLVLWDNTGLLHRALPYEPTSRRLLHRTTLVGEHAVA